jgi:hypothetical protein
MKRLRLIIKGLRVLMRRNRRVTDQDRIMSSIGAILIIELKNDRALRRKIRGTNLETKLKKYI